LKSLVFLTSQTTL